MKKYVSPKVNVIKLGSSDNVAVLIGSKDTGIYQAPYMQEGWEEDEE